MLYWADIIDANVNWSLVQHNPSVYWQVYMNKYARIITAQPNMLVICQKSSSTLDSQYSFSKTHFCKLFSNDDIITFWNFCHVLNLKSYDKHVVEEQTKSESWWRSIIVVSVQQKAANKGGVSDAITQEINVPPTKVTCLAPSGPGAHWPVLHTGTVTRTLLAPLHWAHFIFSRRVCDHLPHL